ncbi:hypothetical protein B9Z65_6392 [Elsinoe australis]|uniref:BZIP domain-containing protein n=1 Tax=Elsinoe australis TaxID=40998 RepID=A0A2P8A8J6_9PEZI|nr:hypothetical protein B9Z65_6392 [Elsinoe australis]
MHSISNQNAPRKSKPKRRMSELDENAAQRRRTQLCKAQRAYRQRRKDEVETLTAQVNHLTQVIEQLNTCFLGLTDHLLSSAYIRQQPALAKVIRSSVEDFIDTNKTVDREPDHEDTQPFNGNRDEALRSETIAQAEVSDAAARLSDNRTEPNSWQVSSYASFFIPNTTTEVASDVTPISNSFQTNTTPAERVPSLDAAITPYMTPPPSQPLELPFVEAIVPSSSPIQDNGFSNFAQRIYRTSMEAAYKLVTEGDERSEMYQHAFSIYRQFFRRDQIKNVVIRSLEKSRKPFNMREVVGTGIFANSEGRQMLTVPALASFFRKQGFHYDTASDLLMKHSPTKGPFDDTLSFDMGTITDVIGHSCDFSASAVQDRCVVISVANLMNDLLLGAQCAGEFPAFRKDIVHNTLSKLAV